LLRWEGPLGEHFRGRFIIVARLHVVASLELKLGVVFQLELVKVVVDQHRREVCCRVKHSRLHQLSLI